MANGKALQKLKDNLDEKGCYFGKFNREYIDGTKKDINNMGSKVSEVKDTLKWLNRLLIGNFLLVIVVAVILKFWGK